MWYRIDAKTQSVYEMFQHANNSIGIFMNINENIRNYRKIAEILRSIPTKLHISQMLVALNYQTCF